MAQKSVSAMVSGAGLIASVWTALDKAVRKRGGTDEHLHRLATPAGEALIDEFADRIVNVGQQAVGNIFQIVCEGSYKASELVKRGGYDGYDWFNDWITDQRFPLETHRPATRQIELAQLDYDPTSDEVLVELKRRGLKPPTAEDALYFGFQHKDEQRKAPIIFLHEPVLGPDGNRYVLALRGFVHDRNLDLDWFDSRWNQYDRFAGVRESR